MYQRLVAVDMPQLTIPIAAKHLPAAAGAVQDPVTKALVGVLNADSESDRESTNESVVVPFAPVA